MTLLPMLLCLPAWTQPQNRSAPARALPDSKPLAAHVDLEERPAGVVVTQGPILLHAGIQQQWGGHTFSYLVEGERGVFWSALAGPDGPVLVGQAPVPGSDLEPRVTTLDFSEHEPTRVDQPQILRTPDGSLHLFVGLVRAADEHGDVRYLRSVSPEDVSRFEDQSERIPRGDYPTFHQNRKNVGIDRAGERVVLVVLTDFVSNRYLMNTPLVFLGEVEKGRLSFRDPVVFGPQTPFFYPQVAATDQGPVLLGSVDDDPSRHAELVHLDWDGELLAHERLPFPDTVAQTWSFEMEPIDPLDWSRLMIVRSIVPEPGERRWIEFWTYDARTRELVCLRSIENDLASEPSVTNAGQLWTQIGSPPLFLSEPASSAVYAWEGLLESTQPLRLAPLAATRTSRFGLPSIRSVFVPSVLQGSLPSSGRRAVALDADLPCTSSGESGPCAWLLWWLERNSVQFEIDSDFEQEADWMEGYLQRGAAALIAMLDAPQITPPRKIRVEIRRDPASHGIAGWASGEHSAIGLASASWPRDHGRLWIVAHELVNLMVAHYAGSGGFPSDWWSNGRSPFAEYASCLVMRAAGHPEAADWRRADGAGQPDHDLYWELDERYGFALFARFFELLREDEIDLGEIEPVWPLPSAQRSLYTAAYLSLAAGENLAPLLRAAGIGAEPEGWKEAHSDWPFTPYVVTDEAVSRLMLQREQLFDPALEPTPELQARRTRFVRGAAREGGEGD